VQAFCGVELGRTSDITVFFSLNFLMLFRRFPGSDGTEVRWMEVDDHFHTHVHIFVIYMQKQCSA